MELEVTKATGAAGQVWSGSQANRCGIACEPGVARGPQETVLGSSHAQGCLPGLLPSHRLAAAGRKV